MKTIDHNLRYSSTIIASPSLQDTLDEQILLNLSLFAKMEG